MWIQILIIIVVVALLAVGFIAMRKDRYRSGGALGNALQEMHSAFDPGVQHTIEEIHREHIREDDSGEPPADKKPTSHFNNGYP